MTGEERKKKSKLLLVLTVLTYIFLIGPMLVMIGTAFNAGSALAFPPTGFSLQWFEKAFSSPSFIEGFKTSFVCRWAARCWPCCWACLRPTL